jgi:hypothetical protein
MEIKKLKGRLAAKKLKSGDNNSEAPEAESERAEILKENVSDIDNGSLFNDGDDQRRRMEENIN